MSFLHYLFLGHFEHNGNTVRFSKSASNPVYHPVVLRSLDREAIKATLQENQGRNGEDLVFPENWGIWLEEGYLVCDKYTKVEEAIHFITRLVERTDCEIYDVSARCEISLKDWLTVVDGSPGQPLSSLDVQGRDSGNTRTDQPMEAPSQQAFILRIAPSRSDRVPEALQRDRVYIGWSKAEGLLDAKLDWGQFRQIIRNTCYSQEQDFRRSGKAAGEMWRFIRKMRPGDLVVVPHSTYFYVAEVQGLPEYDPSRISEDLAYSRPVLWLNNKNPIPRKQARAALQIRMKVYNTCAYANDLLAEIKENLKLAQDQAHPNFENDLRSRLIKETLEEIQYGRINDRGFEKLVASILRGLGAEDEPVIKPRQLDKGADIIAHFRIANTFPFTLAVQAKHYQPGKPIGKGVVETLRDGMEEENADLGWVATSGTFSPEAQDFANRLCEEGIKVELLDGEDLAALIVENGLKAHLFSGNLT